MKKKISIALMLILIVSALTSCGSSSNMSAFSRTETAPSAAAPMEAPAAAGGMLVNGFARDTKVLSESMEMEDADIPDAELDGGVAGPSVPRVTDARKIIRNVDMRLQTQSFDTSVEAIPKIVENFGGYIQDSYVEGRDMYNERGNRSANFTIRVPVERLDGFVDSIGGEFHVISKSQNSQDISESYYDSKARLDALKIQEERLLEMLKQASELEYLLLVEKELMNVRYEIESLTSSLNRMDSYVSMSTVSIYLSEVVKYEPVENVPVTFSERISRAFVESWKNFGEFSQNFAVVFVASIPALIVLAVIVVIIVLFVRASSKRYESRKARTQAPAVNLPPPPSQQPQENKPEEK